MPTQFQGLTAGLAAGEKLEINVIYPKGKPAQIKLNRLIVSRMWNIITRTPDDESGQKIRSIIKRIAAAITVLRKNLEQEGFDVEIDAVWDINDTTCAPAARILAKESSSLLWRLLDNAALPKRVDLRVTIL